MTTHPRLSGWLVVAVFLLAYNVRFRGVPGSSVYAGFGLLLLLARNEPVPTRDREVIVMLFGGVSFAAISVLMWLNGGPTDLLFRAQYLLFFGAPAGAALALACRRQWSVALRSILYAAGLQGGAIVITYGLHPARTVVSRLLVQSGNISLDYAGRPSGFSNSSGSLLAVIQALGACAGLIWMWSVKRSEVRRSQYSLVAVAVGACIASSVLAGRTGVIVLAIFLFGRSLQYPKLVAAGISLVGVGVAGLVVLPSVIPTSSGFYAQAQDSRRIMLDLLELWRGQFFDVYRTMPWPTIGGNLLFGDPTYFAPGRRTHDAGLVQTVGSVGIPAAFLAYGPIVWLACQHGRHRLIGWSLLCWIVLALEMKEPFIFKGPSLAIVVALSLCQTRPSVARRQWGSTRRTLGLRPLIL